MGQDYHIYLHSEESNSLASNTKPKSEVLNGAFSTNNVASGFNSVRQFVNSGFSNSVSGGIATLSKTLPIVAIGAVVAKEGDRILTTGFQHMETYTGNYRFSMEYNNFKTIVGSVINPIGFLKKSLHLQFEQQKFNDKQAEYRKLMGERYIGV